MADTGHNWEAAWNVIDAAIALTNGGTVADTSAAVSLDGKAGCIVSIDTDYSDHALSGTGLQVFILADINGTAYEADGDGPWGFEMPFTQAGTHRRAFAVLPAEVNSFKDQFIASLFLPHTDISLFPNVKERLSSAPPPPGS